jgi:U32 family peptidase
LFQSPDLLELKEINNKRRYNKHVIPAKAGIQFTQTCADFLDPRFHGDDRDKMKNKKTKQVELIAPAGNLEKMETAFAFGADAVYLGIPDFSLRVRINDFTEAKIKEAVLLARKLKKKVYVTINIFAHNAHLGKLPRYVKFLKDLPVDALIISDPGIMAIVKKSWPKARIHLSTQANCTNWSAAQFWQKFGVKRIVLGREVTLEEIKEIHKKCPKMELEYFIHGAMCMAYSGRCFLSKEFTKRSGNLGDCAQPCRWEYFLREAKVDGREMEIVQEQHGTYLLNSKDLCLIKYLDKLAAVGVTAFKIEGRAKSVYYQAVVVNAYRQAIEQIKNKKEKIKNKVIKELYNELETRLVHRGYTTGFLFGGKANQNTTNSHNKSEWEFCGTVISNAVRSPSNFIHGKKYKCSVDSDNCSPEMMKVKVHNTLKVGDEIEIIRPYLPVLKMKLEKMFDAKNDKEITEAHGGGGGATVIIEGPEKIPALSVLRRKIK